jgi:hypothetical protein
MSAESADALHVGVGVAATCLGAVCSLYTCCRHVWRRLKGYTPLSALGLRWPLPLWLPASWRRRLLAARLCPVVLRQGSSQPAALDRMQSNPVGLMWYVKKKKTFNLYGRFCVRTIYRLFKGFLTEISIWVRDCCMKQSGRICFVFRCSARVWLTMLPNNCCSF